ncbi:hypothetical protein CDL15_Pgr028352 [Punica granatum]|uniref:UPF3 domain-containing protein n=1 Tax=Punica granatum TaxID=22663 RepID=A0A218W4P4_PUNGR|nr:hypothetical protein CDL15_Pgr028352 [Punica granatum]
MKTKKEGEAKARSKVVVRHLPPSLSRSDFFGQIDTLFADRCSWTSFRPGKISSRKGQQCSRAYVDFKRPEDVINFAGFFDGHVFVNEKGAHFKAIVEYAPCQRVPKRSPRDSREGTIYVDPDYLEFLKLIAKPVENHGKPAIQLEAIEAEQAEETPVVTPLMEFVRQRRAVENGIQDASAVGKSTRKALAASKGKLASVNKKHGQARKKDVLKDSKKGAIGRDKSENDNRTPKSEKKKILLLRGKELEVPKGEMTSITNSTGLIASEQSHLRESSQKLIRTILLKNEAHQSSSSILAKKIKPEILDKGKQLPQPTDLESSETCYVSEDAVHSVSSDNYVKKTADDQFVSKDLHAADNIREKPAKHDTVIGVRSGSRTGENLTLSTRQNISSLENGSKGYFGHGRTLGHNMKNDHYRRKDGDFRNKAGVKSSKRAVQEKRVWVQKSSSESGK